MSYLFPILLIILLKQISPMDKLGQIKLENTISVQMNCTVNEQIIANNFGIIMDCLRDLSDKQSSFRNELNDLNSLRQQVKNLNDKFDRNSAKDENSTNKNDIGNQSKNLEKSITGDHGNKNKSESKEIQKGETTNQKQIEKDKSRESSNIVIEKSITGNYNGADFDRLTTDLNGIKERVSKNEGNINDNIKDINVIYKDIKQIKELLNSLGKQTNDKNQKSDLHQKNGPTFDFNSIKDIHSEIMKKQDFIDKINEEMEKMIQRISQNEKDIAELKSHQKNSNNNEKQDSNHANNNNNESQISKLNNQINDLKDKLNILSQKLSNNILDTDKNTGQITNLDRENSNRKKQTDQNKKQIENLKNQLNRLIQQLDESNTKRQAEMRHLKNDINKVKKGHEKSGDHSDKKNHSNTSVDEQSNNKLGIDKSPYTQHKFYSSNTSNFGDAIRELQDRVKLLEKMMSGSKSLLQDERNNNPQKLPMIRRPIVSQKQKQSQNKTNNFTTSKKDIGQLKAEIQAWVKNYFESGKQKGDLEAIELQIQQLRNMLNRKADYEGMKKGLTFLENKINQLYLFLTEPDAEDAMIVRKGFNCLSCSKKVQKLRGRLGPNINWNNMTTTNYSPPRVGYSKPMGQASIDKDD